MYTTAGNKPLIPSPAQAVAADPAHTQNRVLSLAIWLGATLIAGFFSLLLRDSARLGGMYLPRGNDSFYHARRILDAIGARGFYEFDTHLHAPDGSWIAWPWGYDYLVAKATQVALWIDPALDPMAFIIYVPVAWIAVNAALFMAASREIGLSLEMSALAMLCFALSPLTQLLHGVGMIDHHYIEHTFVLLNAWLGLRWFKQPDDTRRAIGLGAALGLSQAFHNGLFILELVPLSCVCLLWLRGRAPASRALYAFGIALVAATQLVLLPSAPYRHGMFAFGLLSWFHFYVACCTAAAMAYMGWRRCSMPTLLGLVALSAALVVPLGAQLLGGAEFLSGKFSILGDIVEAESPYRLFTSTFGPLETASHYSWLLLLAPPLLVYYAYRVVRERAPERLYYAVVAAFGLALLLDQLRLQYYGFFALITGGLVLVEELRSRLRWHRGLTFVVTFACLMLAYQPCLRDRLFVVYAPAGDPDYASAFPLFVELHDLCAKDPGVVLANSDDGSAILFHSDCSVIANNFILRADDAKHIEEITRLMSLSPEEIRAERPDIKYLLVRVRNFSTYDGKNAKLLPGSPIAQELFASDEPPAGYTLVDTIRRRSGNDSRDNLYARLFRISQP